MHGCLICFAGALFVFAVCFVFAFLAFGVSVLSGDYDEDLWLRVRSYAKKLLLLFAFLCIGSAFLPDKQDLLEIYGIGGTIDYIKRNDKAKELPDKVVDALTRYVDSIEKEKEDK